VLPPPAEGAVLDVCCGAGRHLAGLSALGYEVVGIERDPRVADAARRAAPAARIVEGDASRLRELVSGPYAGVVCLWQSFGYGTAAENAALLGAMAALLERDGKLLRRSDATWLLTGEAPGTPARTVLRVVSHRRRLLRQEADGREPALATARADAAR
jgi:SAM-dependent methyltransferase